jgi:hypothetical protein
MIIVCYPVATGGNFIGSLVGMLVNNTTCSVNLDGSMHNNQGYKFCNNIEQVKTCNYNDIVIIHELNIKKVVENFSGSKVIYVSIDQTEYDIQEKNFLKKCILALWSEDWYNRYRSDRYPPYESDISKIPEWVIKDILDVNRQYITNWEYIFPEDVSNILCIKFHEILHGTSLLDKLKLFLDIDNIDQSVYNLVNNYRSLQ